MFWKSSWAACRIAGSGSSSYPSPDVIAGKGRRRVAIECKAVNAQAKYFTDEEIKQLCEFASIFGAEPWVAVKFNNKPWAFFPADTLPRATASFVLTLKQAEEEGFTFERMIALP